MFHLRQFLSKEGDNKKRFDGKAAQINVNATNLKFFLIHSLPFSFLNYFSSTAIFVGWLHVALQTAQGLTKGGSKQVLHEVWRGLPFHIKVPDSGKHALFGSTFVLRPIMGVSRVFKVTPWDLVIASHSSPALFIGILDEFWRLLSSLYIARAVDILPE